jgi:hypothetical protein
MKQFKNNNNKVIGEYDGETFKKKVKRSIHFMRNFGAWGVDKSVIEDIKDCKSIEIYDTESKTTFKVPYKVFLDKGFAKNFGYGMQIFLPEKYWEKVNPNQNKLL